MTTKDNQDSESSTDLSGETSASDSIFEQTDANPRAVMWAAIALLGVLVASSFIVAGVRHFFSPSGPDYRRAKALQTHAFEQVKPLKQAPPGVPIRPRKELVKVRRAELHKLSQYRWVDPGQSVARIPIKRAAEIIVAEQKDADATGGQP